MIKKRIGFFNSVKTWGGGEKWHLDTAVYFLNKGYDVCFFVTVGSELHKRLHAYPDIKLFFIHVRGLSFLNPLKILRLKNLFKRIKTDVLFVNLSDDLKIAGRAATRAKVPRIIYTRGVAYPVRDSALNRFLFKNWVTDILASSHATAAAILENNPGLVHKDKIKVIYNPIDVAEFTSRDYHSAYDAEPGEIVIASLGRLEKEKNHIFLIRLSEHLKKKGVNHKIIIGGTGSLKASLREKVSEKKLNDHFIFTGFVNNVKDLLMCCDIFMLPSLKEGFGFVMAEASLCKKPIIAFNTSSIPELVDQNKTGFIIDVNDVEQCGAKITYLKDHPEERKKMGEEGFRFVSNKFDKAKIMAQLEEFINVN